MASQSPDLQSNAGGYGPALRERRRHLSLTQVDLADLAEVSVRLVHEVEHGKQNVQLVNLNRIVGALGLHLQLVSGV